MASSLVFVSYALILAADGIASDVPYDKATSVNEDGLPSFASLTGTVVGIFAQNVNTALAREGRSAPENSCGFAVGRHSFRLIYLPVDDAGEQSVESMFVAVGTEGIKRKEYPSVRLVTVKVSEEHGLPAKPYCLMKVEVNDGLGSPATADRFVATKIEVINQTPDAPLDVMLCVNLARERFEQLIEKETASLNRQWVALSKEVMGDEWSGDSAKAFEEFVTWLPENERLLVRLTLRMTGGEYRTGTGTVVKEPSSERLKPDSEKPLEGIRYGTEFALILPVEYQYDGSGVLQDYKVMTVDTSIRKLETPKEAR